MALQYRTTSEENPHGDYNDHHSVQLDEWVCSIERVLEDVPNYLCNAGHPGRISRIPEMLREADVKAYEPCFISFGPYHYGKEKVQKMEKSKQLVLKLVLQNRPEITIKDYLKEFMIIEPLARKFYSDVEMESEKFVRMLLLDSLYVITLFFDLAKGREDKVQSAKGKNEGMATRGDSENILLMARGDESTNVGNEEEEMPRWFWILIVHDLFLLENQIPFFVLQKIYALAYDAPEAELLGVLKDRVRDMFLSYTNVDTQVVISPSEEVHHLLHLCHKFFRPTIPQESTTNQHTESAENFRLGNAVQLYKAGVKFEARTCSSQHCLLDVTFASSGNMSIPSLHVDDNTVSLLRNLIALEQMKYPSLGLNISAYVVLLLHLITIPEDVKLLRMKGIIQHHLASDKEMVLLVNRLSVGLAFDYREDKYSLKPVFQEMKRYSERRIPAWRAWLKHRHFKNPWTVISLLAASILLFLTIVGTFYSVYSYYRPRFGGNI